MDGKTARIALAVIGTVVISACTSVAPPYSASIDNVETLKKSGASPAAVGAFAASAELNSISMRGNTMESPFGGSYGAYLADAIRQELSLAKLLDPKSNLEISGALLKNDVSVGGVITGSAVVEARVVVKRSGQVRFDKVISATMEFDSNFLGAIAVARGKESYPAVVRKFLTTLYADPDFTAALK
jgi:hypothetical protein